ncbi:MAG: hypothetical protein Q8N95_07175 [Desulfobacterales bacterium]|nr:hypothetical protein [Desulfobacterales bacterium]
MGSKSFEDLKKINEYGAEYWSAREIQPLLGYMQWRRFENAVKRAITSCKNSGNGPQHHFAGAGKPIEGGKASIHCTRELLLNVIYKYGRVI